MNKKLIALFAACSMIATAAVGLVQTAYAADPGISVVVTDGASDNQKVLTYYYNNMDGIMDGSGYFDIDETATIDSIVTTVTGSDCYTEINTDDVPYGFWMLGNGGKAITSNDHSFLVVTITVPNGEEVETKLSFDSFRDSAGTDYYFDEIVETVTATPPTPPEPVVSKSVENSAAYTEADGYDANVVVGTIQLDVTDAAIDLTAATYKGQTPTKVEGADEPTSFIGSALITVIINGETDPEALSQIVFN